QIDEYLAQKSIPGGTTRNWDSYSHKISVISDYQRAILCDPQTSGGLLVAVDPTSREEVQAIFKSYGLNLKPFGYLHAPDGSGSLITVE
ncbi:MAG: selenide, water dikinase SelD, partial [Bacteroidota bacterium]|nr:selenide, water dikinase SelD [Bacteroidota bacterium]